MPAALKFDIWNSKVWAGQQHVKKGMFPSFWLLLPFNLSARRLCVPESSGEGSRKSLFRLANTSASRSQGICIMPFQNAESQTHGSQYGWCFLSRNRMVFVDLFVFLHAAPNNINLTTFFPLSLFSSQHLFLVVFIRQSSVFFICNLFHVSFSL